MENELRYLQDFPITRGMSTSELSRLHAVLRTKELPPDAKLCSEDAEVEHLFLVRHGQVAVLKRGSDGHDHRLLALSAPTIVGELELIDGLPASTTVVTTEPTTVSVLSAAHYDKLAVDSPELAAKLNRNIARVLARRLYATNQELVMLADPARLPEYKLKQQAIATRWQFS